jgi:hypothetical protein
MVILVVVFLAKVYKRGCYTNGGPYGSIAKMLNGRIRIGVQWYEVI